MKIANALFDALLEPCFLLNKDLKVTYCNETAAVVCGLTTRKIQRMTFPELFTFSEPLEWMQSISSVNESTPYKEVLFKTSEGGEGKVQITCQKMPVEGEEPQWIVYVRDVTLEERLQKKYRGELEQKEGYILELQKAQAELEKYSKNLEKMVEERTAEIRQLNRLMSALLDSLGQGFFVFDKDGLCHDFSSKACETVLEGRPNNRPVWDVLKLPENKVDGFKKWLMTIYADMLPFEDLAPLGPPTYPHSEDKHIQLEYFPLMNDGTIEGIVVVASDITSLLRAQQEAETERENAKLILNLINKKQQISRFVHETQLVLKELSKAIAVEPTKWDTEEIFRGLHTVKGGCASFNLLTTTKASHHAEHLLTQYKENPNAETASQLREQCSLVEQEFGRFLTETKTILGAAAFSPERFIEMPVAELRLLCSQLSHWTKGADLAEGLRRRYIMEPVGSFFEPYSEVIQSVAETVGKQVKPHQMEHGNLAVVPEVYSTLFSTLVHAYRNAVDHGIETPDLRVARGKSFEGSVRTRFLHEGAHLVVQISDDGGGIDPAKIRERLAKRGFDHSTETDDQVIQHVFDSSFSTREQVTETSGRGVGMDAIKIAAESMGGKCWVKSTVGQGTVLTVSVPWIEDLPVNAFVQKAA